MSTLKLLKNIVIGRAKNPQDKNVFRHLSLIAFFAWVGLGADGLSSSCYGPEEAFLALGTHKYLGIFVALLTALTVILISASYSQIIALFPTGGGGYLVASKLLNPTIGMISGCALLIDYVLTISISIASGADALFSFLPASWQDVKYSYAIAGVFILMVMNMRGVKESVISLTPIFLVFVVTHIIAIFNALITHGGQVPHMVQASFSEMGAATSQVGLLGSVFIILRAYSLGAGTFTGIEAVSNGLPILRDPKVETGKKTMRYMAFSLAFMVVGLMAAYLLFDVHREPNKTLNAVLLQSVAHTWSFPGAGAFVFVALVSEAMLLFVAAQAGFIDGPRVLANMAVDRWVPSRFSGLSDRLVAQNGVLLMGLAGLAAMAATHGSVHLLVILYSINVFITFCLSQAGMVRHWWLVRKDERKWVRKISVNGVGLLLTAFIFCSVVVLKFHEGGWVTLVITGFLVILALAVKKHYRFTLGMLHRLDTLVETALAASSESPQSVIACNPRAKTAGILVNGFNGLGLHTLMGVMKSFGKEFKNFVFVQVGVIDAGNFKGIEEMEHLRRSIKSDLDKYVVFMNKSGFYAEGVFSTGIDVIEEVEKMIPEVMGRYPDIIFFGGQLVFPKDTLLNRLLHNYTVFSLQRKFYQKGISFMILPIRI
jgi:amino acid transporter